MNFIEREMHRVAVEAAARLPLLAQDESIKNPVWAVRPRKNGRWRAYLDGNYWVTTGCRTEADAPVARRRDQAAGGREGRRPRVRRIPAAEAITGRQKAVERRKLKGAKVIRSTLKAWEPYVVGLHLRHLTDEKIAQICGSVGWEPFDTETLPVSVASFVSRN